MLFRLAQDGHNLTIFDSCSDPKPVNLGFNATIIHAYLPPNEKFELMLSHAIWVSDPHSFVLALIHKVGDEFLGNLVLNASEKVNFLRTSYFFLNAYWI